MSGCALRRWGTGCAPSRPADTPAAKEMAARLAAMMAARDQQDTALWGSSAAATAATSTTTTLRAATLATDHRSTSIGR